MKHHHKWIIALAFAVGVAIVLYATRLGTDDEITQRVVDALRRHPAVNSAEVRISFVDGIVTMTGSFPDLESQRLANEEARKIRGVVRVVDETVIKAETDASEEAKPLAPTENETEPPTSPDPDPAATTPGNSGESGA